MHVTRAKEVLSYSGRLVEHKHINNGEMSYNCDVSTIVLQIKFEGTKY